MDVLPRNPEFEGTAHDLLRVTVAKRGDDLSLHGLNRTIKRGRTRETES